jgi:hypothetical protein
MIDDAVGSDILDTVSYEVSGATSNNIITVANTSNKSDGGN